MQGTRDKETGLRFTDRVFYPKSTVKQNVMLWSCIDLLILLMVVAGLFVLSTTGFSIHITWWFYPVLVLICGAILYLLRREMSRKRMLMVAGAVVLAYIILLLILQDQVLNGAHIFYYQIRCTLQQTYNAAQAVPPVSGGGAAAAIFLVFIAVPIIFWIAFSIFKKENFLMLLALLIPVCALIFFCGAGKNVPAMFLQMFGILACLMSTRSIRHKRLWGNGDHALYEQNKNRFQHIQKRNIVILLVLALILSIPGYYVVSPFLGMQLKPVERVAHRVQSKFLSTILAVLPEVTADQWNLTVETVGGGVSDGALQEEEGYRLEGVEDLRVTVTRQPDETIYLKGYVGSDYEENQWKNGYETTFQGSALNWNTEGDPGIYVSNLAFLRTGYAFYHMDELGDSIVSLLSQYDQDPVQITVERLQANSNYTYVPYGAYLNDYYVSNGDGAVEAQDQVPDQYYFYYKEDYENILDAWNGVDGQDSELDATEAGYHAYCMSNYLEVEDGLDDIQEKVDDAIADLKLNPAFDTTEIVSWVREFLTVNYEYDINVPPLEENVDFIQTFFHDAKKGYSIHFASAGVELFRMFGVPARYVIGYEAPKSLFAAQSDGTYTAVLQDDNAQAWVEIYVDGIGWTPVDVTPGSIGTLEEVGPGGEKIQTYEHDEEEMKLDDNADDSKGADARDRNLIVRLNRWINQAFHTDMTVEEMIHLFTVILIIAFAIILSLRMTSRYCRAYGYDPFKKRSIRKRVLLMYRGYYDVMRKAGLPEHIDTASEEYLRFVEQYLKKKQRSDNSEKLSNTVETLRHFRDHMYGCCYGDEQATEEDIELMRSLRKQL